MSLTLVADIEDDVAPHPDTPLEVRVVDTLAVEVGYEVVVALLDVFEGEEGADVVEDVPVGVEVVVVVEGLVVEPDQPGLGTEEHQVEQVAEY